MNVKLARIVAGFAIPLMCACAPKATPRRQTAVAASPPTRTPPAKAATMICRNSQTGAAAECGTPNAVMVGIKSE